MKKTSTGKSASTINEQIGTSVSLEVNRNGETIVDTLWFEPDSSPDTQMALKDHYQDCEALLRTLWVTGSIQNTIKLSMRTNDEDNSEEIISIFTA